MAKNVVKDSANWASIWVKEVNLGAVAGSLPGGSAAASVGMIINVKNKIGVVTDTPQLRPDGNYWATVDMAALVRISGTTGTGLDGAPVYITPAFGVTLTASTNVPVGFLDRPKVSAGDDIWVQLVPGFGTAIA